MAKAVVTICCWRKGHMNELFLDRRQEEALVRKIPKLKAICPSCRQEGNFSIFIHQGQTVFLSPKIYQCRHGHVTSISALSSGMLHVRFGNNAEDFVNIEGTIEELEEILNTKDISCHHLKENGRVCDCKLKPIDDYQLTYPSPTSIRTKTRVGDLWDRAGIEPVRTGSYDNDGNYRESKTEKAHKARLQKMRRKRNIQQGRHPGRRVDRATEKEYGRRSKQEIRPERLRGPQ